MNPDSGILFLGRGLQGRGNLFNIPQLGPGLMAINFGNDRHRMNTSRKAPPLERANLNLDDKSATRHWIKKWGVTRSEMQRAIDKVGPALHAVAKELGKQFDL